ncbi:MAG TPA: DNA primase [Acidimicrobiales bacterium]|nr:DNA primase [Acidimicrobiales bacterium]
MAIPDEEVAQVRSATDIVALIGEHVALRHQGRRWVGLCPFHGEKTPSFSVNAEEGLYYCFGCQASGDAISFVRAVETLDFAEAVRQLASRAGITLHEGTGRGSDSKWRGELLDAMERAVAWYHERLLSAPDAGPAREYLRSLGYDAAVVRKFRLGWAPDDWDALSTSLKLSERVLTATGLGFVNRRGRRQDAFRGRIIFPICDPSGHPVALGGRILPPRAGAPASGDPSRGPEPKYKNSQETVIYSKRRTLYGLNWAKKDIVATGEVVVCEGYTDVIGFFQAGVERAVATCGTALAEEHFRLLRNFGRRIVLAYDADSAGETATARVYEWERRHEVDVVVATLPAGTDPGELAMRDPKALAEAVAGSRPFLQFRLDRVLQGADLSTPEGRAKAADAAIAVIAEHPDDLVRDQYAMTVSDWCRLEPEAVRRRLEEARRRPSRAPATRSSRPGREPYESRRRDGPDQGPLAARVPNEPVEEDRTARPRANRPPDPSSRPGMEALRLAVHRPEAIADRIEDVLFGDELQRRAFLALAEADSLHDAIDGAPPDVADLLRRVAVEEPVIPDDVAVDPVDDVVAQLVRVATRRALSDLQVQARTAPEGLEETAAEAVRVRLLLEELDDSSDGSEATRRLLAWLLDRRRED